VGDLERGGPARGRQGPSSEADPARGSTSPQARRTSLEGGVSPRARRTLLERVPCLGRSGRPWGPSRRGLCCVHTFCVRFDVCLHFAFFAGFKQDSPRFFRGPSGLSPTVAPEHLRVYLSGSRRCWNLLIGHSSPWLQMPSAGLRQRTRGSSPRSPAGVWVLLQGFYRGISSVGVVHVPTGISNVSAGFGDARGTGTIRVRCIPGGVAVRRAPEPGPIRGDRDELFVLF
jgi:hypothetical protein